MNENFVQNKSLCEFAFLCFAASGFKKINIYTKSRELLRYISCEHLTQYTKDNENNTFIIIQERPGLWKWLRALNSKRSLIAKFHQHCFIFEKEKLAWTINFVWIAFLIPWHNMLFKKFRFLCKVLPRMCPRTNVSMYRFISRRTFQFNAPF